MAEDNAATRIATAATRPARTLTMTVTATVRLGAGATTATTTIRIATPESRRSATPRGMMRTAIRRLMDTATSTGMLRTISVAATATADEFRGDSDGLKTNKQIQVAALKSGLASAEGWSVEDLQVVTDGSTAEVKGRSTLTKCIYNGQDFSGVWEWTDKFARQKDGSWKAVS